MGTPYTHYIGTVLKRLGQHFLYLNVAIRYAYTTMFDSNKYGPLHQVIFGALVSEAPRMSEKFIGTGESWLFSYKTDNLVTYTWSGENTFIMQGSTTSLVIGSDQEGFGLWFDGNLNIGSTQPVSTFNSECLTKDHDFIIENIELNTFFLWIFK